MDRFVMTTDSLKHTLYVTILVLIPKLVKRSILLSLSRSSVR
ncbi:potassium voltage-gated channel subfamily KQT [Vibrio sp. JCM 18904]|nr:potassium voltage-gated channel subfamily KQT [Vibrio sp. JCM 18904]